MTKKQKNIAFSHITAALDQKDGKKENPLFSGGITGELDFIPENILLWRSSKTLKVTDTSIHQRMILKTVLSGKITMIIDGLRFSMKKGDMITLFPFQFHTTKLECPREDYSFLAITFTEKRRDYSPLFPLKNHLLHPDKEDMENLIKLIRFFQSPRKVPSEKCVFALLEILLNQKRKLQKKERGSHEVKDLFDRISDHIREHFEEALSLKSLAEEFHITPETIRRLFHKADIDLTPGKLIARLRLQQAVELLEHTDLSIGKIALRCGYKDPFSFSRAFKNSTGRSPSFHRKKEK